MQRKDSSRLCLAVCSIGKAMSAELSEVEWCGAKGTRLTLLIPLLAALLFSAVGDPKYISFFRFTPGVASSVFLRTF
jgi:hypothetical protein